MFLRYDIEPVWAFQNVEKLTTDKKQYGYVFSLQWLVYCCMGPPELDKHKYASAMQCQLDQDLTTFVSSQGAL